MPISAIRDRLSASLAAFAWDEWAQMGVSADARRVSPWAADPEANFLFGLEIGRADPRLFDELLDWLVTNANVMSAQRLRNMSGSEEDEQLVEAALAWASRYVRSIRVGVHRNAKTQQTTPLFYGSRAPSKPDPAFLELGLLKPSSEPSGKSRRPDTLRPINFAFLVRQIFGVGSRAEVMRFLLTATVRSPSGSRPLFTTLAIAEAAGFAKRNVQETLNSLVGARAIEAVTRGNERLYSVAPAAWTSAIHLEQLPSYRDWPNAFLALRELHRWLWREDLSELTPYMLSSEARRLMRAIEPALVYAGIPVSAWHPAEGADYWPAFEQTVEQILHALESGLPW